VSDLGPRRAWGRTLIDLIATLPRYRLEALVNPKRKTAPLAAAAIAAVLSLAWLVMAVAALSGGPGDTLRHWWSTLPAVALLVSVAALLINGLRRRSPYSER
jgi:peptidoglycan/LPS O-acetylase OafA/YrhL